MKYAQRSFVVAVGSKEYRETWDRIFSTRKKCRDGLHDECEAAGRCTCECHSVFPPKDMPR